MLSRLGSGIMPNLVDVFPIDFDLAKFPLSAFRIQADNDVEIGATLAARVRKMRNIPCAWVRDERILVAAATLTHENLVSVVEELWNMQLEGFDLVNSVYQKQNWQLTSEAIAQFVAIGVLDEAKGVMKSALSKDTHKVKVVNVDREADLKGFSVDGKPVLQITLSSPMSSSTKLSSFYDSDNPDASIRGRPVRCKGTKGIAEKKVGELGGLRAKLKSYKPTDYDPAILDQLPDNHPVIEVRPYFGKKRYHYPLDVLEIIVDMGNLKRLGLDQKQINEVSYKLKISPDKRALLVSKVRDSLVTFLKNKYPAITIGDRYNSTENAISFLNADNLEFNPQLCFGKDIVHISKDTEMLKAIKDYGLFKKSEYLQNDVIQIGIVDAIPGGAHQIPRKEQLQRFSKFLKTQQIETKSVGKFSKVEGQTATEQRAKLTSALKDLIPNHPNIILIYLPDSDYQQSDDDELSLYNTAKSVCIAAGIASQVIMEGNVGNEWADDNLLMGILGKTGNIPYVLGEYLGYANAVVGLDVSRQIKSNAAGTINTAAMSRIYTDTGELSGYAASGMSVQGEIIPRPVLEKILPEDEFKGKSVIIHRDGKFVGEELNNILEWGEQIKAEFLPIEVVKSGVARFYKDNDGTIDQADKGTIFILNENSAYLVSSPPPKGKTGYFSTSRPLQINNYSRLTLNEAIHSVLALTLLHYGSVRSTRLPVSTHASDKIAGFLKNIGLTFVHGDVPFWL
jgi:Piwi domain